MRTKWRAAQDAPWIGLGLSVALPSAQRVHYVLGRDAVVAYVIGLPLLFVLGRRLFLEPLFPWCTGKRAVLLAATTFAAVIAAFAVLYPLANAGTMGRGSDRDDALNIAARELVHGRYPYYPKTYLENPISPLPGAILLAVPFWLLGTSAYQNLFWLLALLGAFRAYLKDTGSAVLLWCLVLALSPVVWHEVVTGGDTLANSIYIFFSVSWMSRAVVDGSVTPWQKALASILVGIALSSRAHFFLVVPIVVSMLAQNAGWRAAATYVGLACATFSAVTLPVFLYDPAGFSPLHTLDILDGLRWMGPAPLVAAVTLFWMVAAVLSARRMERDGVALLEGCALALAFPAICVTVLYSLNARALVFPKTEGLGFLLFASVASWARRA